MLLLNREVAIRSLINDKSEVIITMFFNSLMFSLCNGTNLTAFMQILDSFVKMGPSDPIMDSKSRKFLNLVPISYLKHRLKNLVINSIDSILVFGLLIPWL